MGSRDYHEDQRVSRDLKDITRIREYCPITLFAEKKRKKHVKMLIMLRNVRMMNHARDKNAGRKKKRIN